MFYLFQLLFAALFAFLCSRESAENRRIRTFFLSGALGLALEAASFSAINYEFSLSSRGEGQGWFEAFSMVGGLAAIIFFVVFAIAAGLDRFKIFSFRFTLCGAAFLACITLWTWFVSHVSILNWW